MKNTSSGLLASSLLAALALLVAAPEADAKGTSKPKASHAGGHHPSAGRAPAAQRATPHVAVKPPKAMKPSAPRAMNRPQASRPQASRSQVKVNRSGVSRRNTASQRVNRRSYARQRGDSHGNRYASGSANASLVVRRLRATHATLARVNRDYQGHRVRAMVSIAQAIRQLEHRSGGSRGMALAMPIVARRNKGAGNGRPAMSQAQADSLVKRSLQSLKSIDRQMTIATNGLMAGSTQGRARGSIRRAIRELDVALSVR